MMTRRISALALIAALGATLGFKTGVARPAQADWCFYSNWVATTCSGCLADLSDGSGYYQCDDEDDSCNVSDSGCGTE
jgi:hypothetical protein